MENNSNRRILFAIGFVLFFAIIVLIWYFFYAKPVVGTKITETNDPLPTKTLPVRFQFLNWGGENTSTTTTEIVDPLTVPLVKVWDKPATGQIFITQNILKDVLATTTIGTTTVEVKRTVRATSTVLMFVDRTTGYVYGYSLETGKPFQISNTLLPGIYDAYFFEKGKRVIMRYIDQEKNRVVGVIATIPTVQESEVALPLLNVQYVNAQVTSVATNLKKEKISYVVTTDSGSSIYTIGVKGPEFVVSSPFGEWALSYGDDSLKVTSKPSAFVLGSTFSIPSFQSEIIDKTGLMSNPGPEGYILSSMWGSQGLATFMVNNGDIKALPFKTLAQKCSWGEKKFLVCAVSKNLIRTVEGLPDDWFQGRVSFDDDLFLVDSKTGDKYTLYLFKPDDGVFDIANISIAEGNNLLSFNKKQDGTLWLLNLNLVGGD